MLFFLLGTDCRRALLPAAGRDTGVGDGQPAGAGRERARTGGPLPARERRLEHGELDRGAATQR